MDPESREKMIRAVGGTSAALPETWHNYAVPHVATSYKSVEGDVVYTTLEMIVEEVTSQTGKRPVSCRPSRHGPDAYGNMTWVISFKEPVGHFQLFGTSNHSSKINKKPQIQRHNPGCQGYCNPAKCVRGARCAKCGGLVAEHDGPVSENCTHPDQCANCYGPHRSGHMMCPAAPRRENGRLIRPTKKELITLRRTGRRAYGEKHQEQPQPTTSEEAQVAEAVDLTAAQTPATKDTTPTGSSEVRPSASPAPNDDVPTSTPSTSGRPKRTGTGRKSLNVQQMVRASSRWGPYEHTSSNHSTTDREDTTMEENSTIC